MVVEGNQFFYVGGGVIAVRSSQIRADKNRFYNMIKRADAYSGFVQFDRVTGGGNSMSCNVGQNNADAVVHTGDIFNVYASFGESYDPIRVYGNRVYHSIGVNPSYPGVTSGGVTLDGAQGANVKVIANTMVNIGGGALSMTSGDGIEVAHNRVVSLRPADQWTTGISGNNFWGASNYDWYIPGAYCRNVTVHNNEIQLGPSNKPNVWFKDIGNDWPLCENVNDYSNESNAPLNDSVLNAVAPDCAN